MKIMILTVLSCLVAASAMASVPGRITSKIDSQKAEVQLQGAKAGDRVSLMEEICEGPKVKLCRTEKVGEAVVSKVINSETSEITAEGKLPLKENLLIEKK
ncbi:hypothetical protein ACLVWU_03990 [Bdellovibrio sp. HCB290]|uniref:hypothetical protein n=1 Tax=Bdellovibrio sp. HCB290 TaxID=3394356 RepID=UPI0039B5AE12